MTFSQYRGFIEESKTKCMNNHAAVAKYQSSVPDVCPKCGAKTKDDIGHVIHDVEHKNYATKLYE